MDRATVSTREITLNARAKDFSTRFAVSAGLRKPNCCLLSGCRAATLPPARVQRAETPPPPDPASPAAGLGSATRCPFTAARTRRTPSTAPGGRERREERGRGKGRRDTRQRWASAPHHQGSKTAMAPEGG